MKKTIKQLLQGLLLVPVLALGVTLVAPVVDQVPVMAQGVEGGIQGGADSAKGDDQQDQLFGPDGVFKRITDVLLFIIGAISVIMLIIGGIRYTTSNGESGNIKSAKDTILFAVIGIVIAILAYALVNFVVDSFSASSAA